MDRFGSRVETAETVATLLVIHIAGTSYLQENVGQSWTLKWVIFQASEKKLKDITVYTVYTIVVTCVQHNNCEGMEPAIFADGPCHKADGIRCL